jgi:hypothetical protein
MDKDAARLSFNRAFSSLQSDCGPIKAMQTIPTKDGGIKARFANYESIRESIDPLLRMHGFTVSYSQRKDGTKTVVTCTLRHNDGHEIESEYTCGGVSAPGNNEAQNDAGTNTTANRMCLCNMLGIVIDKSGLDARMQGDTITGDEADEIGERVERLCGGVREKMDKYLELGEVTSWASLKRAKYEVLCKLVAQQERKAAATKPREQPPANQAPFNPSDLDLPKS